MHGMIRAVVALFFCLIASASPAQTVNSPGGSPTGAATGDLCGFYPDPETCRVLGSVANAQALVPPSRVKDFIADFGGVPVEQWGVTANVSNCQVLAGNTTIYCPGVTVLPTVATNHDLFNAQGAGPNSQDLDSTITAYIDSHHFTIADLPTFTTTHTQMIGECDINNPGAQYSFGSVQTLVGGTIQTAAQCAPKTMQVVNVRVNQGGSGATLTTCPLTLNPTANTGAADKPGLGALSGIQATFSGGTSGGVLQTVSLASGADYKSFSGYTYTSGWYLNIPVTSQCSLTGATVDISFGILQEGRAGDSRGLPQLNGYDSTQAVPTGLPCDSNVHAAASTSSDNGTGATFFCKSTSPMNVSWYFDNTANWINAVADENAATAANQRECIRLPAIFAVKPTTVTSNAFNGFMCILVDLGNGFDVIPNNGNTYPGSLGKQVWACVNCYANNSQSATQMSQTDPNSPTRYGPYIPFLTCYGMGTSTTQDDCGTFYGKEQWGALGALQSWNLTGHMIGSAIGPTGNGSFTESTGCNTYFRTEHTGSLNVPAIDLAGIGSGAGDNNFCIGRLRNFDDPAIALRILGCTTGNGTHAVTVNNDKTEQSSAEQTLAYVGDANQIGATTGQCGGYVFAKSDGTTVTGFSQSGVSGITFNDPEVTNVAVDTCAYDFLGTISTNVGSNRIAGGIVTANSGNDGMGVCFGASGPGGNFVDMIQNNTSDYNLVASGALANNPLIYDANDVPGQTTVTAFIDNGKSVACLKGLGLLILGTAPNYSCMIPNASLQNSFIVINNQTMNLGGTYSVPYSHPGWWASCNTAQADNSTAYYPINGQCINGSSIESAVSNTPENSAATYSRLFATTSTTPGAGTITYTLRDNGSTVLTCTITAPSFNCNDATHTVPVAQGDKVDMQITTSGIGGTLKVGNFTVQRDNPS